MADDLLVLARLRAPEPAERQAIVVADWLAAHAAARRHDAEARGLTIESRVSDERLRITGVRELLDRALDHALDNALKFSRPGGRIELSAMRYGAGARVAVGDDGVGFDPTDAARVFGRFERSPTPGAEHLAGAGLGLALVHEIAEVHGGRAWAQSALGRGTQILLALPLAE